MYAGQYKGRRVFITGHTGFKGSWLAVWLRLLGAEVTGYSLAPPSSPSAFEALGLRERLTHIHGDVRDREGLRRALERCRPEVIFHLAAQSLVRPSYDDPALTFETNVMGVLHLFEAARLTPGVRAVVCVTSDKCYRNEEWVWGYRENDPLGGKDPYSASKACAELVAQSYFASFPENCPRMATVRAGNVIGGGDWARDRLVPDCARAWAAGQAVPVRNPFATRPWQHVLEPLSGYLWLGARLLVEEQGSVSGVNGEAFNFGPAAERIVTVAQVTDALAAHWPGFVAMPDTTAQANIQESVLLKLCCDKALALLQWKSVLDFEAGIALTADWYREYYAGRQGEAGQTAMLAFTEAQIRDYSARAAQRKLAWTL